MSLKKMLPRLYKIAKHNLFKRSAYKISFCTVSMNRLHHIKRTLPANINDNATYPHVQFVLLDYNSSDGLEDWIKSDMKEHIDSGRLVYYRTTQPQYFHRSHSRNMAFQLATGDIVCNLDADNFTGKDFAHYINREFISNNNIYIVPDLKNRYYYIRDVFGRITCWKKDFDTVGGFDEQLDGYGHEDVDFVYRLIKLNREEVTILNRNFLKAISHTDLERVQNESSMGSLDTLYISHIAPHASHLLFLFTDNTFTSGTLIDTVAQNASAVPTIGHRELTEESLNGQYKLEGDVWRNGTWKRQDSTLLLSYNDQGEEVYAEHKELLAPLRAVTNRSFTRIVDQKVIIRAINLYSLIKNSVKVQHNKTRKLSSSKELRIGEGSVTKNFVDEVIIGV